MAAEGTARELQSAYHSREELLEGSNRYHFSLPYTPAYPRNQISAWAAGRVRAARAAASRDPKPVYN